MLNIKHHSQNGENDAFSPSSPIETITLHLIDKQAHSEGLDKMTHGVIKLF